MAQEFISITSDAISDAISATTNIWDEDSYTTADFVNNATASGITHTESTGAFTVGSEGGVYRVWGVLVLTQVNASVLMTIVVSVDGTPEYTLITGTGSLSGIAPIGYDVMVEAAAGEDITMTLAPASGDTTVNDGSTINIARVAGP